MDSVHALGGNPFSTARPLRLVQEALHVTGLGRPIICGGGSRRGSTIQAHVLSRVLGGRSARLQAPRPCSAAQTGAAPARCRVPASGSSARSFSTKRYLYLRASRTSLSVACGSAEAVLGNCLLGRVLQGRGLGFLLARYERCGLWSGWSRGSGSRKPTTCSKRGRWLKPSALSAVGSRIPTVNPLSLDSVSQMDFILLERLLALVRPASSCEGFEV